MSNQVSNRLGYYRARGSKPSSTTPSSSDVNDKGIDKDQDTDHKDDNKEDNTCVKKTNQDPHRQHHRTYNLWPSPSSPATTTTTSSPPAKTTTTPPISPLHTCHDTDDDEDYCQRDQPSGAYIFRPDPSDASPVLLGGKGIVCIPIHS